MTSRGWVPLIDTKVSSTATPARAAGEPGRTATTRGSAISFKATPAFAAPDLHPSGPGRSELDGSHPTTLGQVTTDRPVPDTHDPSGIDAPHDGRSSEVSKVLLCAPRGFCAGVEMAIKALSWLVRAFEPPVYCYHEIVHNKLVVDRFVERGVIFVDDIAEVPEGRPIMLSAHGSAPEVVRAAQERGSYVVDAVCPLVTKVHHEVKVRAGKGYQIIYVGHEGHEEAVGTMAVAPDAIHRVESVDDVTALPAFTEPTALLAQTTLSHRDWASVADAAQERFPDLFTPGRSDLCFATTNRQSALVAVADRCDAFVVIGSANSSNTNALAKLATEAGCARVFRVNGPDELPSDLGGVVGVTAGASAPEGIVTAVIELLDPTDGVEEVTITDEDEYFPPPRNLRQLLTTLDVVATLGLGGSVTDRPALNDRQTGASEVLATL
jgi:4-hydroxy-3-methylbut-2-enyl diphosphate reductase